MVGCSVSCMRKVWAAGIFAFLSFEGEALAVCGDIVTFNDATTTQGVQAKSVSVEFDVTGIDPADYPDGKGWLLEFAYTQCKNTDYNDFGGLANLKIYGNQSVPGNHASGSIKFEYGLCCVSPPGGCPDNWASGDFQQAIFTSPSQKCHVKSGVDPTNVSYSIQCDGGTTYAGTGDNVAFGLMPDKVSVLKSVSGGHAMAAKVQVSNVQVCWELAPPTVAKQQVMAIEDATISSATPTTVVTPDTDLACGPDDGNVLLKFTVPASVGKVTNAKLTLTASSAPSSDGDGGDLYFVSDNSWSEKTVTWNNAPKTVPPSLGKVSAVTLGGTYSVDVTSKVPGPGTYSFALTALTTGSNGAHFLSKEASSTKGPRLVLEADPDAGVSGAGGSAGTGGSTSAGSGGSGASIDAAVGGGGGTNATGGTEEAGDDGCGCRLAPRGASRVLALAALGLGLGLARRRRR